MKARLNIGIVSTWFRRGAAYVTKQYEQAFSRRHNVFIYARGGETSARDPAWRLTNVTYGSEPVYPETSAVELADFEAWIRRACLDVVIFNEQSWWPPVVLCAQRGIRTVAFLVEYQEAEIPLYGLYDVLFAHTQHHLRTFPWHPGLHFIPWGTAGANFRTPCLHPVSGSHITFLHSAGLNANRKGTDLLVDAYSRAVERGLQAELVLHFQRPWREYVWDNPKGPQLLVKLSATPDVKIIERNFAEPADIYQLGDVCVYPARFDGLGLTIAEANASGVPVIAPDHAPWNEFIDGDNGTRIPTTRSYVMPRSCHPFVEVDVGSLAEDLLAWSRRDVGVAKAKAWNYARQRFDWDRNSAAMSDIVERCELLPDKASGIRLAEAYEKTRRVTVRQKLSFAAPTAVRYLRRWYRLFTRSNLRVSPSVSQLHRDSG